VTALLVPVSAARADVQVASSGQVEATFSFDRSGEDTYENFRLRIVRAGQTLYDAPVVTPGCPADQTGFCDPAGIYLDEPAVHVRDLDADGEPEAWVDLYTGGAHCCVESEILRFTGSAYARKTRHWSHVGYRLTDHDENGVPEFESADAGFAYVFGSFAESAFPIRVFDYRAGVFEDVTSSHRAVVRKDAKRWWRLYRRRRNGDGSLGVLAAWTADQYALGRRKQANRFLRAELRAGRLRAPDGSVSGAAYIRKLKRMLERGGYAAVSARGHGVAEA
jgi:hypothetical protein